MGKQPAFLISLKGMDAAGYETACQFREQLIQRAAFRNRELPAPLSVPGGKGRVSEASPGRYDRGDADGKPYSVFLSEGGT